MKTMKIKNTKRTVEISRVNELINNGWMILEVKPIAGDLVYLMGLPLKENE